MSEFYCIGSFRFSDPRGRRVFLIVAEIEAFHGKVRGRYGRMDQWEGGSVKIQKV